MQQFQFNAKTDAIKFACLLDPWKKKPEIKLTESGDTITLTVSTSAGVDTWTWQGAKDSTTPTPLVGKRGATPLIALTEKDKAPHGE